MRLVIKYRHLDWWFWLVIGLSIGAGLAGWPEGYQVCAVVSAVNLVFYALRERSLTRFMVQVRIVWLAMVLAALWPPLAWLFIPLFIGMVLVVLFDRCGIARMLILMPWNKGVKLS